MKIILLNGAAFSGKDTLASRLVSQLDNAVYIMFKQPLYERFAKRHNLTIETVKRICDGHGKDKPNDLIGGLIPRQELIDISENELKVEGGPDEVARLTVENIRKVDDYENKTFVFPDSGFSNELIYLQREFPEVEIFLARIMRDGCNFTKQNDSRSYLPYPNVIIDNNIDETDVPKEHRGINMLNQFLAAYQA